MPRAYTIYKLYVQPSEACVEVLKYVDKKVGEINRIGALVNVINVIKSVDPAVKQDLERLRIKRFPALVSPRGECMLGFKQIVDMFENNLGGRPKRADNMAVTDDYVNDPAAHTDIGNDPDLSRFWAAEMFQGVDRRGRVIARKDEEEDDQDENDRDIDRRMRAYQRKIPKQRRQSSGRRTPATRRTPRGRHQAESDSDSDNVGGDNESDEGGEVERPKQRKRSVIRPSEDAKGDEMDERMMNAWLDNNPED